MNTIDWSKLSFSYTQTKALVYSRGCSESTLSWVSIPPRT